MRDIIYKSDDFVIEQSPQYILSIRFLADGLSFCVRTPENDVLLIECHIFDDADQQEILAYYKEVFLHEEILSLEYSKIEAICSSYDKLLIPNKLYDESLKQSYWDVCFTKDLDSYLFSTLFTLYDVQLVTEVKTLVESILEDCNAPYVIYSEEAEFLSYNLEKLSSLELDKLLSVNVKGDYIDVAVLGYDKLLFYNSFDYLTTTDIIYNILNVLDGLGIKIDDIKVLVYLDAFFDQNDLSLLEKYLGECINIDSKDKISSFIYLQKSN